MTTPQRRARLKALTEAALNLGMSTDDARVYASKALDRENEIEKPLCEKERKVCRMWDHAQSRCLHPQCSLYEP